MAKIDANKIDEYIISAEFREIAGQGSFEEYHKAYWALVAKFGREGIHYLERADRTNPIKGYKKDAGSAVIHEWRDSKEANRHSKAEWRANLSLCVSVPAAIFALISLYFTLK